MRCYHQHGRLLQVCTPPFDLDPEEAKEDESRSAQEPDDGVVQPLSPADHRTRARLLRQTGHPEPSDGPHDEEHESGEEHSHGEEDTAQDNALKARKTSLIRTFLIITIYKMTIKAYTQAFPLKTISMEFLDDLGQHFLTNGNIT